MLHTPELARLGSGRREFPSPPLGHTPPMERQRVCAGRVGNVGPAKTVWLRAPPRISWLRPLLALGAEIRRGWRTLFSDGVPRRLPRLRPRAGLRSWEPAGLAEYRAAAVRGPSRKDARIRISRLFVIVTRDGIDMMSFAVLRVLCVTPAL